MFMPTATKSRLGMVAAIGRHEGPWILANGVAEIVARVHGLSQHALLWLELAGHGSARKHQLVRGDNIVEMQNCTQYRLVKEADGDDREATTVEFRYS